MISFIDLLPCLLDNFHVLLAVHTVRTIADLDNFHTLHVTAPINLLYAEASKGCLELFLFVQAHKHLITFIGYIW